MTKVLCAFAFLLCATPIFSQENRKSFTVKHISETELVSIDGILDESIWKTTDGPKDFQQYFPADSILAAQQTEIKMAYSATTLYIGTKVYTAGDAYVIPSLRRDFRAGGNDNISFLFDTFNDGTNAFLFGTNPYGVRREALISNGGSDRNSFTTSWDVKWKGQTKIYDGYYIAEMAIPLSSFKFREGETKWRFNCYRFDVQSNETSTWIPIPQNQLIFGLAFMGDMIFEKPLGKSRTPLTVIPYINAISSKDFETNNGATNFKTGGDVKVAIGNGANLDITINPDFSNVEVDNIVTNLTRFEVSLPERRQFFVDNSDLFGSFGGGRDANPFFSRRIGIARDTAGNSIENKIIGGLRFSGKISETLRLGILNIQTAEDLENEIPSNNNAMFALQQKLFARSNIGVFFINRETFKDYDFTEPEDRYNRVLGIDYNLASKDNSWRGKFYAHKSFQPGDKKGNYSTGAFLAYNSRFYNVFFDAVYIDEDFSSDLGFIRRTDIFKTVLGGERIFRPKKGNINQHSFQFFPVVTWRPGLDFKNTDYDLMSSWSAQFTNRSSLSFQLSNRFVFLTDSFDPTFTDGGLELPADQGYHFNSVGGSYQSDSRKVFSYQLESSIGRFFNGNRFSIETTATLRLQPKAQLSLLLNYNSIELPDPFPSADIWLLTPRVDITFSKSVFWSTLIQYSNLSDNLGINSRLQWRFAPLSDLFLVYNDNYVVSNNYEPRFRSINLKLTYWLNI